MITAMSREGLAMVSPYPFFAGALAAGLVPLGALAGLAGGVAPAGPFGAISALMENRKVCTCRFLSSCFASLISTFWKYPERFSAVIKLATEFTDADAPSIDSVFPLRVMLISHRFSVRETVLATSSISS